MTFEKLVMEEALDAIIDYRGRTPQKSPIGIPTLSAKSVKNGQIDYSECYYISPEEYKKFMTRGFPQKGDILLTTEAPLGMVAKLDRADVAVAQRLLTLRGKKGVLDNDFLMYYLQSSEGQGLLKAKETGTTVTGIKQAEFRKIVIKVPDFQTQKQIAAILSALDEKIAINRAINENLERQAQALFKSWFVDFDSVSKLGFTESELGDIPYGWRIYTLSEFLPVKTGKKNANVSSDKGAYPFFSCSQDFSWTDEYSFEGHAILVAGNGDFNVKWYNGKFEAYQRTYVLIPYVERYTDWLYYAVKYNLESITSAARGSVIKFITKGNLENFAFAAPENLEKCEIIDTFSSINRIIDALTQENYRLAEIRDSLLPKLMSGEIDTSTCNFTDYD